MYVYIHTYIYIYIHMYVCERDPTPVTLAAPPSPAKKDSLRLKDQNECQPWRKWIAAKSTTEPCPAAQFSLSNRLGTPSIHYRFPPQNAWALCSNGRWHADRLHGQVASQSKVATWVNFTLPKNNCCFDYLPKNINKTTPTVPSVLVSWL